MTGISRTSVALVFGLLVAACAAAPGPVTRVEDAATKIVTAYELVSALEGNYPVWLSVLADRAAERGLDRLARQYTGEALIALERQGRLKSYDDHVESSLAHMIFYTCVRMARLDLHFSVSDQSTDYFPRCIARADRYFIEELEAVAEDEREQGWDLLHVRLVELAQEEGFEDLAREIAHRAVQEIIPHYSYDEMIYAGV